MEFLIITESVPYFHIAHVLGVLGSAKLVTVRNISINLNVSLY